MRRLVGVCLLFSFSFSEPLSLYVALEKLEKQSIDLELHRLETHIAQTQVDQANALSWGKIDLVLNAMRSNEALSVFGFKLGAREATFGDLGFSAFDPSHPNLLHVAPEDLNYPKPRTHFQSYVELTYPLFNGGKLEAYTQMAQRLKALKILSYEERRMQLRMEVKKVFYGLTLLEKELNALHTIHAHIQKMKALTQGLHVEGYAKRIDLLEVDAKEADTLRMITQLRSHQRLTLEMLSFLLDEEVTSILPVEESLQLDSTLQTRLEEESFAIQKAKEGVALSKEAQAYHKGSMWPIVGVMGRYGSADEQFLGHFSEHDSYTVGLMVQWNLFNGGGDPARVEQARLEGLKASGQLELARRATRLQWQQILSGLSATEAAITSLEHEVHLAEAIYASYQERYGAQLVPIHEVLQTHTQLLQKQMALYEARHKRHEQLLALELLIAKE